MFGCGVMPFGFEHMDVERILEDRKQSPHSSRTYIEVVACNKSNGAMIPLVIHWTDGREYKIEKLLEFRQGRSLKDGFSGKRYKCQIGKRCFYLYYDGERWYVESRYL
jgi:hypothetical protein